MSIIVCDASVLVEYLLRTPIGHKASKVLEDVGNDLHAPSLCDVEVVSVLRKIVLDKNSELDEERAKEAIDDLIALPITRHSHEHLIKRAFELRNNISIYDGVYLVLAEKIGGKLVTADKALASSDAGKYVHLILLE